MYLGIAIILTCICTSFEMRVLFSVIIMMFLKLNSPDILVSQVNVQLAFYMCFFCGGSYSFSKFCLSNLEPGKQKLDFL